MKKFIKIVSALTFVITLSSCVTAGRSFDFGGPQSLTVGKTTIAQVAQVYGEPFRVGYQNGLLKWTYGYYKYRLFGDTDTKDLLITFDKEGVVKDYTYSTSLRDEKTKLMFPPK